VDQALLELSDQVAHIPMLGGNSSMNVVTACAIATSQGHQPLPSTRACRGLASPYNCM
jgi:hypothetical protein